MTPGGASRTGALSALRVLELGTMMAGPMGATLLADFGADVVKLEPAGGDPLRDTDPRVDGAAVYWMLTGRNKRSIVLDIRDEQRRDDFFALIDRADVLFENFRAGQLERLGIGPDVLLARNPRLVIVRVTGFGQTGPLSTLRAYDRIVQLMGGLAAVTGFPDSPPTAAGFAIADQLAAVFGAFSALLGLAARDRTDAGQVIDVGSMECLIRVSDALLTEYDRLGVVRGREGNSHPSAAPMNMYLAGDGNWVYVQAPTGPMYTRLTEAMGRPQMATDSRFATAAARFTNRKELDVEIQSWVSGHSAAEVEKMLIGAGVPTGRVRDVRDLYEDQALWERGVVHRVDTPVGPIVMQGIVPLLTDTPGDIVSPAPALGNESVESVLAQWSPQPDA